MGLARTVRPLGIALLLLGCGDRAPSEPKPESKPGCYTCANRHYPAGLYPCANRRCIADTVAFSEPYTKTYSDDSTHSTASSGAHRCAYS